MKRVRLRKTTTRIRLKRCSCGEELNHYKDFCDECTTRIKVSSIRSREAAIKRLHDLEAAFIPRAATQSDPETDLNFDIRRRIPRVRPSDFAKQLFSK